MTSLNWFCSINNSEGVPKLRGLSLLANAQELLEAESKTASAGLRKLEYNYKLVRGVGLEPTRLVATAF